MYELKEKNGNVLAVGSSQQLYNLVHERFGGWGDRYIEVAPDRSRGHRVSRN